MCNSSKENLKYVAPACGSRWLKLKQGKGMVERPLKQGWGFPCQCGPSGLWGRVNRNCVWQALSRCLVQSGMWGGQGDAFSVG